MGIEIKQIFIVLLIIPWLILLSQTEFYPIFRKIGAVLVGILAVAWLFERISGNANFITISIEKVAQNAYFLLFMLIIVALLGVWLNKKPVSVKNSQ